MDLFLSYLHRCVPGPLSPTEGFVFTCPINKHERANLTTQECYTILQRNFNSLSKENVYENNHLAFRVAEEQLGIPALLDAEDMVKLKVPDRLSILTYVSQYYNYFHGRSPIGGMGGIKRPPPDTTEEPVGKKLTNHVPQPTPTTQPAQKGSPAVVENAPVRAGIREINPNSTVSSNCAICGKHVHLVQRHMADGKLYHRNCFRCKQCSRTLQPGMYKIGDHQGTLVCTNQHCNTSTHTSNSVSSNGPYAPVVASSGGNRSSPVPSSQPSSTPTIRSWQSTTSPSVPAQTNKIAAGFANKNTTDVQTTTRQESGYSQPSSTPTNRTWQSTTSPSVPAPTNRTASGFANKNTTDVQSTTGQNSGYSQPGSTPNNRTWQNTTSPSVPTATNRTATGFANQNTTDFRSTAGKESGYKTTTTVQYTVNKDVPTSTNTTKHESTNKMAVGFYGSPESRTSASSPLGPKKDNTASNSPTTSYLQTSKANKDSSHSSPSQNNFHKDTQKDSIYTGHQTKMTGSSGNVITVSSLSTGKWSAKDETKEPDISAKPWLSSAAKNKEARERFFQSSPVVPEPTTKPNSTGPESPKISVSNGPGRSVIINVTPKTSEDKADKDKARNFLLQNIPKSSSAADTSNSLSTPKRLPDPQPNVPVVATPKTEPEKPVPKERKSKVPTSVSNPEPPKGSPSTIISKGYGTPSSDKSPLPAPRTQPAQPRVQKVDEPSPKTQSSDSSVAPENWRAMLKSVDKKPTVQRTVHEPKPTAKEPESTPTPKKPTTITIIPPSPADKENKPTQPPVPTTTPSPVVTESTKVVPPKKKLLVPKIDLISDWPKPEQKWQDSIVTHDSEVPRWRSHKISTEDISVKESNPSPVENNNIVSPNKLRPEYIPEEEIQRQLRIIEQELDYLEQQGVELEKQLRSCDGDDSEDSLMVDWFKLIHEKQLLLRQESELNYISKQQALENQQQDVETELRNLMNKPDHLKSERDKTKEKELLEKYLLIVNDRSEIIECLDEDRLREKEEDEMMENMIRKHSDSQQKQPSPNLKRRSRFSFSGWLKPKDKNKT
ncbi:MICAL-like protein 2 isoform X2 [Dendropsophus ebraccatus]|uniref:MICAL-like protein 2 isoform X2 n=1 Tax=Dendropsophus ebraccatus TaxID=150705 RepID=UPI00383192E4